MITLLYSLNNISPVVFSDRTRSILMEDIKIIFRYNLATNHPHLLPVTCHSEEMISQYENAYNQYAVESLVEQRDLYVALFESRYTNCVKITTVWSFMNFKGFFSLAKLTTNISKLMMESGDFICRGMEFYDRFQNITELDLTNTKIGDKSMEILAETFSNLRTLLLNENRIGYSCAECVSTSKNFANLTILDLSGNSIGNKGVEFISSSPYLKNLVKLYLINNNIGKEGGKSIAKSTTLMRLQVLNLSINDIGNDGLKEILSSDLVKNLNELGLNLCNIGYEGACLISNCDRLTNLTSLSLIGNTITDDGKNLICTHLARCKLILDGNLNSLSS